METILIYYTVFLFTSLLLAFGKKYFKSPFNIFSIVGIIILVLFASLRVDVGTDYYNNINIYKNFSNLPWETFFSTFQTEFLYRAIVKITYSYGGKVLTFSVIAALTIIPIYYSLIKDYRNIAFFVSIYLYLITYYSLGFNVTKQIMACSLCCYSIRYVFNNKPIQFIIIILIAFLIHATSIIFILCWFIWDKKNGILIKNWKVIFFVSLFIGFVVFYKDLLYFMTSMFPVFSKFSLYVNESSVGNNYILILYFLEAVLLLMLRKRLIQLDRKNSFFIMLFIIGFVLSFAGIINISAKRISLYFLMPSEIVLFGSLGKCVSDKRLTLLINISVVVFYSVIFFITAGLLNQSKLIPYQIGDF